MIIKNKILGTTKNFIETKLTLDHLTIILSVVVFICGVVISLNLAGTYGLSGDDALHWWAAKGSSIWETARNSSRHAHPPLFFVVLREWILLFGDSPVVMRFLPSLFYSIACGTYTYWASIRTSRMTGICLGFLMLSSSFGWEIATEIRGYSLLLLFLSIALYFYEVLESHKIAVLGWSMVCIAAIFTHYSAIFVVLPMILGLITKLAIMQNSSSKLRLFVGILMIWISCIILFYWNLYSQDYKLIVGKSIYAAHIIDGPVSFLLTSWTNVIKNLSPFPNNIFTTFLLIILIVHGALSCYRVAKTNIYLLFEWLIIIWCPFLLITIAAFLGLYPLASDRHATFLFPLLMYILAVSFSEIIKKLNLLGFVLFFTVVLFFQFNLFTNSSSSNRLSKNISSDSLSPLDILEMQTNPDDIIIGDQASRRIYSFMEETRKQNIEPRLFQQVLFLTNSPWTMASNKLCRMFPEIIKMLPKLSNFDFWLISLVSVNPSPADSFKVIDAKYQKLFTKVIILDSGQVFLHVVTNINDLNQVCPELNSNFVVR